MSNADYDFVIRGACVIDGTGTPSVAGDIAVHGERIAAVGDLRDARGNTEIDAAGLTAAPGFIDAHTHDDRALLSDPLMTCKVSQGVTTVVTGNCGVSLAPLSIDQRPVPPLDLLSDTPERFFPRFRDYYAALEVEPAAVNSLAQTGHSTLRVAAMDDLDRAADAGEIKAMRRDLETALDDDAIGLSTGLFYQPAAAAPTEEVIELAAGLEAYGGLHTTHMRDETEGVVESIAETLEIGRKAHVPVVISHHKCAGAQNHGRSVETLALIDRARKDQAVGLDVYPYVAGSTVLDPSRFMGASKVLVTWSVPHPEHAGRDLDEIAAEMNCAVPEAADKLQPAGAIYFMMDEADVRRILAYPHSMIGSDGLPHDEHPHPRLWGTFPRVLGHYAREVGLFSLEEAVRKMTSLTARQFGLKDRGVIREGALADLVLFDADTVIDAATFDAPKQPATGIDTVMVNGRLVWRAGQHTGARPGRAVRLGDLSPGDFSG